MCGGVEGRRGVHGEKKHVDKIESNKSDQRTNVYMADSKFL